MAMARLLVKAALLLTIVLSLHVATAEKSNSNASKGPPPKKPKMTRKEQKIEAREKAAQPRCQHDPIDIGLVEDTMN